MYTLFLDTHSDKIIIVLYQDQKIVVKKEINTNFDHSITTMPLLKEIIEEQNIKINDISEIVVVNGPGSFTGVRLGVTIAKTLAYTLQIPIKTMSSLLIKAVSFSHEEVNIIEREKNGIFKGTFDQENRLIKDYEYISNKDYQKDKNDREEIAIDYEKVIQFAKSLKSINPHAVNPLYVKKIEVQK